MVEISHHEQVFEHLQSNEKHPSVCHSKKGSNKSVSLIDTFNLDDKNPTTIHVGVLDLKRKDVHRFVAEVNEFAEVINISQLSFSKLPEEAEDLVEASFKRMSNKLRGHEELRKKARQQKELPPELRKPTFSKKNWDGFFVESTYGSVDKELNNAEAINEGFATKAMVDHLRDLDLAFRLYVRKAS